MGRPRKKPAPKALNNVLMFPGYFVADYCAAPWLTDETPPLFLVQDESLASIGIHDGMVIVARKTTEEPPDGSFCVFKVGRERYMRRVRVRRTKRGVSGYYFSNDNGETLYHRGEIRIEAVALYACSCDMMGSACEPVNLTDANPWDELRGEWEDFIDEIEGEQ